MAAITSAVVGVGGALYGAHAADKAADAQVRAQQGAIDEQRRQFDMMWGANAPYRQIGSQALNALGSIYGYDMTPPASPNPSPPRFGSGMGTGRGIYGRVFDMARRQDGTPQPGQAQPARPQRNFQEAPNYSNFFASPDYQFRRDEGMRDIGNSFAARGGAASGNALRALTQYNSNLASNEFGNYFNRQAALAGIGQTANAQGAAAGINSSNFIGNALSNMGDARASGVYNSTNALLGGLGSAIKAYDYYRQPRQQPGTGIMSGNWGYGVNPYGGGVPS